MVLPARLGFGAYLPSHHRPGTNPTLAFESDLMLIGHLDRLDFDEVWIGEHHSGGRELVSAPELARDLQMTAADLANLPFHLVDGASNAVRYDDAGQADQDDQ